MGKVRVTLPDGRIVDGEIKIRQGSSDRVPVLMVEGEPFSGLDAINQGLFVYPINDPLIDKWLNTFTASG